MGIRTPSEAVEYARTHLASGYNGLCLAHVQDAYGARAVEPSAISAWNNSTRRHATSDLASAPYGAPVYWSQPGNPYGHVALHLDGDRIYTTDSAAGHPHEASMSDWQTRYGYQPLGWTGDIEGQDIPGLADTPTTTTTTGKDHTMQAIIQLNDENGLHYFDGQTLHALSHPDQVTALQMVAQAGGFSLPMIKLGSSKAPWGTRLRQALGQA